LIAYPVDLSFVSMIKFLIKLKCLISLAGIFLFGVRTGGEGVIVYYFLRNNPSKLVSSYRIIEISEYEINSFVINNFLRKRTLEVNNFLKEVLFGAATE
jgi:hypothetical protein